VVVYCQKLYYKYLTVSILKEMKFKYASKQLIIKKILFVFKRRLNKLRIKQSSNSINSKMIYLLVYKKQFRKKFHNIPKIIQST